LLPVARHRTRDQACRADADPNVKSHNQRARQHERDIFDESLAAPRLIGFQRAVAEPDRKREGDEKFEPDPADKTVRREQDDQPEQDDRRNRYDSDLAHRRPRAAVQTGER
jgi:hypothetical protein